MGRGEGREGKERGDAREEGRCREGRTHRPDLQGAGGGALAAGESARLRQADKVGQGTKGGQWERED